MAWRLFNRILTATSAPGTGPFNVGSAVAGFQTFGAAGVANNETLPYYAEAVDAAGVPTGGWEYGAGTYTTAGATLARTAVYGSSNAGAPVNFAGATRVGSAPTAEFVLPALRPGGRLTLVSNQPVADSAAAGLLYYTPYRDDRIQLCDGPGVRTLAFSQVVLSLSGLTLGLPHDIFAYLSSGVVTLERVAWANATTRFALSYFNGFLTKSTDATRRYLGTIYPASATTTEDSPGGAASQAGGRRLVWNLYNRVPRAAVVFDGTGSWTYNAATWRPMNNAATNCVEFVRGLDEDPVTVVGQLNGYLAAGQAYAAAFGLNSTTLPSGHAPQVSGPPSGVQNVTAPYSWAGRVGLGLVRLTCLEAATVGTPTLVGQSFCLSGLAATGLG